MNGVPHCLPILHPSLNTSRAYCKTHCMTSIRESFLERHVTNVTPIHKPHRSTLASHRSFFPLFPGIKDKLRSNQRNSVIREYRETIPQIHLVGRLVIRNLPFACAEINFQWEKTAGRNLVLRGGEEIRSTGAYNDRKGYIIFFLNTNLYEEVRWWMRFKEFIFYRIFVQNFVRFEIFFFTLF